MSKLHRDNAGYVGCSYEETQDPYYSYNKLSLPLSESDKTVIREEQTFVVTQANSKFVIDGVSQAPLTLVEGNVYTFDQSDNSNSGHPLRFSYTEDGTHGDGVEMTLGVTTNGTPGTSGAYTKIVVPFGLHDLYYYCSNHSGMGGFANVAKDAFKFTTALPILKTTDAFGKTLGTGNNEDPYAANLVLAIPMNGANNGTTFTDVSNVIRGSGSAKAITVFSGSSSGGAVTSTAVSKYYGSSFYVVRGGVNANESDYITRTGDSDLSLGTGDFCVEFWFYSTSLVSNFVMFDNRHPTTGWPSSSNGFAIIGNASGNIFLYHGGNVRINHSAKLTANAWHHIAVTRESGVERLFVNGDSFSATYSSSNDYNEGRFVLGSSAPNGEGTNGYFQDLRIYKGVAKYTTPFTTGGYGMDVLTYNGNGSTQTISGLNFQPDFIWIKERTDTGTGGVAHYLGDTVRGINYALQSNSTNAEDDNHVYGYISAVTSDGFTVTAGANDNFYTNGDQEGYVAWCWKAGGAPTTDNVAGAGNVPTAGSVKIDGANATTALAGTIPATRLSANTQYGFSIVSYTGTGATGGTVGHGLSSAPKFIVIKNRDRSIVWVCYHSGIGSGSYLQLNSTAAKTDDATYWGSGISSTTFGLQANNASGINYLNEDHIAYCWSEVSGFSKFGSYTGAANLKITTGFRPRFVLIKCISEGGFNWVIVDGARGNSSNGVSKKLYPNKGESEDNDSRGTETKINFLDDGFQFADQGAETNSGTRTYIYAAFAESAPGDAAFESLAVDQLDLEDRSGNGNNASHTGAAWQTSVSKFYGGSTKLTNSTNSYLSIPNSDDFNFGSGDWTCELWAYPTSTSSRAVMTRWGETGQTTASWAIGSNFVYLSSNGGGITTTITYGQLSQNQWSHLAVVRQGNSVTVYVNGSLAGSGSFSGSLYQNNFPVILGNYGTPNNTTTYCFDGYMQDARIYKGIAKYTSSFTPPERSVKGTARRYPSGVYVVS